MRFCIIGTGRSGTTLLHNLLNLHPDVFVFNETHWIPKMYEFYGTGEAYPIDFINIIQKTFHVTGQAVTNINKSHILSLFEKNKPITAQHFCDTIGLMFATNEGKQYWADKTPDYGPYLSVIQHLWPDCKFIHMIRHGADTALSMSQHPGFQWMASAGDDYWSHASFNQYFRQISPTHCPLDEYVQLWSRRLLRIQNEAKRLKIGSYYELRLEDLVTYPDETLRYIAKFTNISCDEFWLVNAISKIDANRIQLRKNERRLDILGERERELLKSLGYALNDN